MKLLLTSAGNTNDAIETALRDLLGKPFDKSCAAFIPTASNLGDGDKRWYVDQMNNFRKLDFQLFDVVDISAIPPQLAMPRIEKADVIIFSGGNVSHLLYWIQHSGLGERLPTLLERMVYVGISAGSIAATKNLILSNPEKKEIAKTLKEYVGEEGMGFVPFLIRPHLNSSELPHAKLEHIKEVAETLHETIYAIDDDTAIKVNGEHVEVISEGAWEKFN